MEITPNITPEDYVFCSHPADKMIKEKEIGREASAMKKHFVFMIAVVLGILPTVARPDEHWALSLSPADIQAAANAAVDGDTVILPAGDRSGINTVIGFKNGVSLRGQGKNSTIIRTSASYFSTVFRWNSADTNAKHIVEISDLSIYGPGSQLGNYGEGILLSHADKMLDFKIHDLHLEDFCQAGINLRLSKRGLIYDCELKDIIPKELQYSGYGVSVGGDEVWDDPKPLLGTAEMVFIEDCTFEHCKHGVSSGYGSHHVVRYCTFIEPFLERSMCDAHGYYVGKISSNTWEMYHNTFIGDPSVTTDYGIGVRGGSGVIWGNTFTDFHVAGSTPPHRAIRLLIDTYGDYPDPYQITDTYMWENYEDGNLITTVFVDLPTYIQENREYFFAQRLGYAPFPYPHPLRSAGTPLSVTISAGPLSGQAPLTVTFASSPTGGTAPYTYDWNFGDGQSSSSQSPTHVYVSSGSFKATLTVSDNRGDKATQAVEINATSAPSPLVASCSASPSSGPAPLLVSFTGNASGGAPPYTFSWTFGDGQSSSAQNPAYSFSAVGSYTATLTVRDSQGSADTKSLIIAVTSAPSQLVATASASPTSGLAPLTVDFQANASGGTSPYTWSWDFGDGGSSTAKNSSHKYLRASNYTASLTVTDSNSGRAVSSLMITATSVAAFNLSLSSQTGAPAPGQGGTTDPTPGTRSYAVGKTVRLRSLANSDYRFSRWSGDIPGLSLFNVQTTVTMDGNKSASATFCTKCADVNGDLMITPADSQAAFDIFLGKIASPTWCEQENADVNLSGTKLDPKVTPSDAQLIFKKYLKQGIVSSDCSGLSRSATAAAETVNAPGTRLTVHQIALERGQEIAVPIILESSSDVTAFGFDLTFPSDVLEYVGLERTDITTGYSQLDANVLINEEPAFDQTAPNVLHYAALRVGGFKLTSTAQPVSGVLVTLIFRVTGEVEEETPIGIAAVFDDLRNASIKNGAIRARQNRDDERMSRAFERKIASKRYDL